MITQDDVRAEYHRLHQALSALPEERWNTQSLCEKWTLKHVLAHLTMPARYTPERYQEELAEVGYDFPTLSDKVADRDVQLPIQQLLAELAGDACATFTTPDGGVQGALHHVVVHGMDMTIPAGLGCVAAPESVQVLLLAATGRVVA